MTADADRLRELEMSLEFLGKDPDSPNGDSPTLYYDEERDTYLFQSWKVTDLERLAQLDMPDHETVIEFPRRMMQFFPEVNGGADASA
ncbi:hypothetical protein [Micromonospora sp. WMMD1082]|uniref:hypothetical protein n=1 Tax=Micromonospora sp. WMMD1082 TaxID=3016104 RepID=UPI002416B3EF|nr:hypothetical protein [Micromonospora sp. WMMD1082]MDG4794457.1 hypothetical protein [Micromonospora sp. WMMD1082]